MVLTPDGDPLMQRRWYRILVAMLNSHPVVSWPTKVAVLIVARIAVPFTEYGGFQGKAGKGEGRGKH